MTAAAVVDTKSATNGLISLDEAVPMLPVSRATLYLMAATGELPTIKSQIKGRPRLVKVGELSRVFGAEFQYEAPIVTPPHAAPTAVNQAPAKIENPAPVVTAAPATKAAAVSLEQNKESAPQNTDSADATKIAVLEERIKHLEIRNQDLIEQNGFLRAQIEHSQSRMDKVVNIFENGFFTSLFEHLKLLLPAVFKDNDFLGKNGYFNDQQQPAAEGHNPQLKVV